METMQTAARALLAELRAEVLSAESVYAYPRLARLADALHDQVHGRSRAALVPPPDVYVAANGELGDVVARWEIDGVTCSILAAEPGSSSPFFCEASHASTRCTVYLEGPRVGDNAWTREALARAALFLSDPDNDPAQEATNAV